MAGFQLIMYGRFWVFTEGRRPDYQEILEVPDIDGTRGPWVLMEGHANHREVEGDRQLFSFLRGIFLKPEDVERFRQAFEETEHLGSHAIPELQGDQYTYAGEVPWSRCYASQLRSSKGRAKPIRGRAFTDLVGRRRERVKRAWVALVDLFAPDLPSDGPVTSWQTGSGREKISKSFDRVNQLVPEQESLSRSDLNDSPTLEEIERGYRWRVCDSSGIQVEIPAYRFGWEGHHSSLNEPPGSLLLAPRLTEALELRNSRQSWDLVDHAGIATLYRTIEGDEGLLRTHFLFLRKGLLEQYLEETNQSFAWAIWGERTLHYDILNRGEPTVDNARAEHADIHRLFAEYPLG